MSKKIKKTTMDAKEALDLKIGIYENCKKLNLPLSILQNFNILNDLKKADIIKEDLPPEEEMADFAKMISILKNKVSVYVDFKDIGMNIKYSLFIDRPVKDLTWNSVLPTRVIIQQDFSKPMALNDKSPKILKSLVRKYSPNILYDVPMSHAAQTKVKESKEYKSLNNLVSAISKRYQDIKKKYPDFTFQNKFFSTKLNEFITGKANGV